MYNFNTKSYSFKYQSQSYFYNVMFIILKYFQSMNTHTWVRKRKIENENELKTGLKRSNLFLIWEKKRKTVYFDMTPKPFVLIIILNF